MKQQRTNAVVGKKIADFFFSGAKRSFQKGSIILRPGESISSIFFIQSGYVRIVHHTKKGDAVTLHLFRPGCFFPLINLFNGKPSQYTIEALSPVTVYEKSSMHVREYLHLHPDVLFDVTARLLSGIEGLLLRVTLLSSNTAFEKVSSLLLYVASSIGIEEKDGIRIPISLSHKDIASWVGTTRETVSLQMEELKQKGRIFYTGRTVFVR